MYILFAYWQTDIGCYEIASYSSKLEVHFNVAFVSSYQDKWN